MGRSKRIKIPKNRDIEEYVAQCEAENNKKEEKTIENKRGDFKKSLEVSEKIEENHAKTAELDKKIERRIKNFSDRVDAQYADRKRRAVLLNAMNKLEANKDENEEGVKEFFAQVKRKTDEYLKSQEEEEKKKINEKYGEKYNIKPVEQKKDKKESKKKTPEKRVSGTSMEEILNSPEFKEMWDESQEQEER